MQVHLRYQRGGVELPAHGLWLDPHAAQPLAFVIMETTFGLSQYRFPPTAEVFAEVICFCRQAIEDGAVPVLLSYSLGKSQEIICALLRAGLVPVLHPAVFRMTEIYRSHWDGFPDGYTQFDGSTLEGKVLICPPNGVRSPLIQRIPKRRTAVLTGWAVNKGARFRYGADAAFPLSDHADYDDLLLYVERVQPRRVYTLHGFAAAFARDLRALGVEAWALSEENQLEFSF